MLTITHDPEKWREGSKVKSISSHSNQVRGYAIHFSYQHTNVFYPFWNLIRNAQHSFNTHRISVLRIHGRYIIHAIHKRNYLIVGETLCMFFKTTMQIPDVRDYIFHNLSVRQNFQSQYTMCGWMLWSQVEDHFFRFQFIYFELVRLRINQVIGFVYVLLFTQWSIIN